MHNVEDNKNNNVGILAFLLNPSPPPSLLYPLLVFINAKFIAYIARPFQSNLINY